MTTQPLTREFLDFLKHTDYEDRLARELIGKAIVYHKTGDAVRMVHDVGIIDGKDNPFILSILTSDVEDEEEAKDTIGKIAKVIYDERE